MNNYHRFTNYLSVMDITDPLDIGNALEEFGYEVESTADFFKIDGKEWGSIFADLTDGSAIVIVVNITDAKVSVTEVSADALPYVKQLNSYFPQYFSGILQEGKLEVAAAIMSLPEMQANLEKEN